MEGGGVKKYQKLRDVIHGRPLRLWFLDCIVLQLIIRLIIIAKMLEFIFGKS